MTRGPVLIDVDEAADVANAPPVPETVQSLPEARARPWPWPPGLRRGRPRDWRAGSGGWPGRRLAL
ncbi:hypothetical protein ACFSZS_16515 [Seohaeicola zhoushanensis]